MLRTFIIFYGLFDSYLDIQGKIWYNVFIECEVVIMPKRLTTDGFIVRARAVHGDLYDYSKVEYVTNQVPVEIICPIHGAFFQRPNNHLQGSGCPHPDCCPGKGHKLTTEQFVAKAVALHGDEYDYSEVVYDGREVPVTIICKKHGAFRQAPNVHMMGCGCPVCGKDKQIETNLRKYGVRVTSQAESVKAKARATCEALYGGAGPQCSIEVREKSAVTVRERYGVDNVMDVPAFWCKISDTIRERYGVAWAAQSAEIREKQLETCRLRYGGVSPLCDGSVRQRALDSKRMNGTFNTSGPEESAYSLLCEKFGSDGVVRQYCSDVYDFACDFYVKSLDLYIEMNLHWSHGGAFYDVDNPEHVARLGRWSKLAERSKYYANAVHVWSVKDLEKLRTARRNNLNYLVFWDNNLCDFKAWLAFI